MGNREAKELICRTYGHEVRYWNNSGRWGTGQRGIKGRKKWDDCNGIINTIYLKKKKAAFQSTVIYQGGRQCKDLSKRQFKNVTKVLSFITYIYIFFEVCEDTVCFFLHFRCFLKLSSLVIQLTKQSNPALNPVLSGLVCF